MRTGAVPILVQNPAVSPGLSGALPVGLPNVVTHPRVPRMAGSRAGPVVAVGMRVPAVQVKGVAAGPA